MSRLHQSCLGQLNRALQFKSELSNQLLTKCINYSANIVRLFHHMQRPLESADKLPKTTAADAPLCRLEKKLRGICLETRRTA